MNGQDSEISELISYSRDEKLAILEKHNITETQFNQLVKQLEEWLVKTAIPSEYVTKRRLQSLILNSKMSLEKSKRTIEAYFRLRARMSDFWELIVPNNEVYEISKRLVKTIHMPKLTPDLCRIVITRVDDLEGKINNGLTYVLPSLIQAELRVMSDDMFLSNTIIVDQAHFDARQLMNFASDAHKIIGIVTALDLRIKNIHFVNLAPILDKVLAMLKLVLPSKIQDKVKTHANFESLHQYIPKEYLPSNYGGTESSIEELQRKWSVVIEKHKEDLQHLVKELKCDKPLKSGEQSSNYQFGAEGSFRQLTID
ncbi:hypothetical protein JTB14_006158 [Gonioctena quinquepunctata]|nr:hypothetical protein JTB14_006158 [Gonioctena quinquepunctata]